jgi:hypothetical protein
MRLSDSDLGCRQVSRSAFASLVVCVFLASTVRDAAAQFPQVTANLSSKSFDQTLPFDEEFKIVGTVSSPVRLLQVFYSLSNGSPPACPYIGGGAGEWRGPYEYRNPAGSTTFEVHIDHPLEAERAYTWQFCSTAAAAPAAVGAFQKEAVGLLDRAIDGMSVMSIDVAVARSLRNQLCATLDARLGAEQVLAAGSLFDCSTEELSRLETFRERLSAVLLPQHNLRLVFRADSYANALTAMADSMGRLASSPELDALVGAMRESGHAAAPDVSSIADLSPSQAREVAEGRGPAVAVSAPAMAQTSGAVAADVARNFGESQGRLEKLYKFLNDNLRDDAVTKAFLATLKTPPADATVAVLRALAPSTPPAQRCESPLVCAVESVTVLSELHGRAAKLLPARAAALLDVSQLIGLEVVGLSVIHATTFAATDTDKTNYVSAEAGFFAIPRQREAAAYIGTNVYFRPVNPHAPLSRFGGIGRRVAMTVGLTLTSLADEEETRFDLFAGKSLVLGVGVRITEVLRLSAGTVVLRKADENPFVNRKSYAFEPYVAFSVDLNLATGQKGFGDLFKPKGGS